MEMVRVGAQGTPLWTWQLKSASAVWIFVVRGEVVTM